MNARHTKDIGYIIGLAILSIAIYFTGIELFYNSDEKYTIYGARFFLERNNAWGVGWPYADIINGLASKTYGSEIEGIRGLGSAANTVASLLIYTSVRRLYKDRKVAVAASITTSLWFMSPAGGWTIDAMSFIVACLPWATYTLSDSLKIGRKIISGSFGAALVVGLGMKLNVFLPVAGVTFLYITLDDWYARGKRRKDILQIARDMAGTTLWITCGSGICALAIFIIRPNLIELGVKTFDYYAWSASHYGVPITNAHELTGFPFKIDLARIITTPEVGSLWFLPIYFATIIALARIIQRIFNSNREVKERRQRLLALYFIISSVAGGYFLGRGISHRLFYLPAGLILSAANGDLNCHIFTMSNRMITSYMTACYAVIAIMHSGYGKDIGMSELSLSFKEQKQGIIRQDEDVECSEKIIRLSKDEKRSSLTNDTALSKNKSKQTDRPIVYAVGSSNVLRVANLTKILYTNLDSRSPENPPRDGTHIYGVTDSEEMIRKSLNKYLKDKKGIIIVNSYFEGTRLSDYQKKWNQTVKNIIEKVLQVHRSTEVYKCGSNTLILRAGSPL
jgi:hypothetical protein